MRPPASTGETRYGNTPWKSVTRPRELSCDGSYCGRAEMSLQKNSSNLIGQGRKTMRAVGVMTFGGPEVLKVVDVPEVHAGRGEVRIRVHAAGVNPTDLFVRNGFRAEQQKADPPPYVPGMDAAGGVDEVGEGVATGVRVGDQVMAMVPPKAGHGAY